MFSAAREPKGLPDLMPMYMASVCRPGSQSRSVDRKRKEGGSCIAAADRLIFRLGKFPVKKGYKAHLQNHGLLRQPRTVL